ncbi:MAG: hypothetical protein R3D67_21370 [Hyphomicrobiaceae bacterium]
MSIGSMINGFLDKTTDARFKRDSVGQLVFFPLGFGSGRIVPDAATEASLRKGCRRQMIVLLGLVIPALAIVNAYYQLKGWSFLLYFIGCVSVGFGSQIYPLWLSRGLARSSERLRYSTSMVQSLDAFGKGFLIFGLVSCGLAVATSATLLAYRPARASGDPVVAAVSLVIFVPLTVAYALALKRKWRAAN